MDQSTTPLYNQLIIHHKRHPISLHVPGHKNGSLLGEQKYSYFHELLKLDVTELTGLDDLHSPEGVIREAQALLTAYYGTKKSYFLVNGSTVGNLTMMLAVLNERDIVLVQRNSHKSVLNGIELAGAKAVFLDPDFNEEWNVTGGVSPQIILRALNMYSKVKAIVLTYPNYYGMVNELEDIITLAHERGIPVLVDEAHGAHFISGGHFPKSAVQLGADLVVQSAHKTLPAMTMGSFFHFNSEYISIEAVEKYLQLLQSSSPSYPIMASLDIARSYIATYSDEDHAYLFSQIQTFRNELGKLDKITILNDSSKGDLLKVTIQSASELSGFQMQALFEKKGIYTEMADPYNVLLVLPLLKKDQDYHFQQIVERISQALSHVSRQRKNSPKYIYQPNISTLAMNPNEFNQYTIRKVLVEESMGEIAAERVTPYPPGIPLLVPGERITEAIVEQMQYLIKSGARFQGNVDIYQGKIKVFEKKIY
jgi:arginine/lysine/ornithine decarboxylase